MQSSNQAIGYDTNGLGQGPETGRTIPETRRRGRAGPQDPGTGRRDHAIPAPGTAGRLRSRHDDGQARPPADGRGGTERSNPGPHQGPARRRRQGHSLTRTQAARRRAGETETGYRTGRHALQGFRGQDRRRPATRRSRSRTRPRPAHGTRHTAHEDNKPSTLEQAAERLTDAMRRVNESMRRKTETDAVGQRPSPNTGGSDLGGTQPHPEDTNAGEPGQSGNESSPQRKPSWDTNQRDFPVFPGELRFKEKMKTDMCAVGAC
ncbi:Uncharacterised protein [Bifidobacterium longum subsp. infantis]|uniref:Uncharacterized protein n=1 Tax=Bifidobacterium longum subsp. infantis TaxID=1682 RepID=A0A564RWD2_BIFLI|nr:Uncharacterised protein [Bifidobacterium longum subsp. infantis]